MPLPRPLMTAEVLDAAFRLFRVGILRCLPYSGLAVLVLQLPKLYSTFFAPTQGVIPYYSLVSYAIVFGLSVPLLGVMTLRLSALAHGVRPRFRTELAGALMRWPMALFATAFALGYPLLLVWLQPLIVNSLPTTALIFVAVPLLWPVGLFALALPAFWCDRLSPISAIVESLRLSLRNTWRMFGAILATISMVAVFLVMSFAILALVGRADLFLISTLESTLYLVVGAFGVPFVLAMLIVAHQDLRLRNEERRGVRA